MIDKMKATVYVAEAKHTYAIFTGMIGKESKANVLYLKWIDAMESLIADDELRFNEDIAALICQPLRVVAEALNQRATEAGASNAATEIKDTMQLMFVNPIEAKQNMIRICNSQIFKLKAIGFKYEYLTTSGGAQP